MESGEYRMWGTSSSEDLQGQAGGAGTSLKGPFQLHVLLSLVQ